MQLLYRLQRALRWSHLATAGQRWSEVTIEWSIKLTVGFGKIALHLHPFVLRDRRGRDGRIGLGRAVPASGRVMVVMGWMQMWCQMVEVVGRAVELAACHVGELLRFAVMA